MDKKKIAVLSGQLEEAYQSEFLKGLMKRSFELNYDVYVFSMYIKYQNTKEREIGDSNIYNLVNYDMFDAVILMSDIIQTPGVEENIEETIHNNFKGPVICIDCESKYFPSFWTDGYLAVYKTISHLIEHHELKDIAYLTGRRNHVHSQRRVEAYRNAMKDHGIDVNEDRIFYGDFWYTSGAGCAETLLRDRDNLPQAVACANDCMAIGLAEELVKNGIVIPDDIVVVGYGTSEEGQNSPRSLTSSYIPSEDYGIYAVDCIIKLMNGEEIEPPKYDPKLYIGESCGCQVDPSSFVTVKRDKWMTSTSSDGYYSIHNVMFEDMLQSTDLTGFLEVVYDNLHHISGIESFRLCLNDIWLEPDRLYEKELYSEGYSDRMINALYYHENDPSASRISVIECFDRDNMLPETDGDDEPKGYIFTPVFCDDKSLGYAVLSYGSVPGCYDDTYRLWINSVARGLECLRRNYIIESLINNDFRKKASKFADIYDRQNGVKANSVSLSEEEMADMEEVDRILDENLLTYHFQPIVNTIDGEIYSYEALMRSKSGKKISPLQIIKYADMLNRLNDVEKATFVNVLNIVDDNSDVFKERKVFINSIPGSKLEKEDSDKVEEMLERYSGTVVVELTEQSELQDEELDALKQEYKRLGTELAVDDYGTGYSNVSNLLRYMPDYVKIDRSLLTGIENSTPKQHFVREAIEFCHDNGIMALAEGVETTEELAMVIKLGADLIQGFYVAKPSEQIVDSVDSKAKMEISRYHRDKSDGSMDQPYIAGKSSRINMSSLIKEGKTNIVIGEKNATYRDIMMVGTPGIKSDAHIEIYEGYDGRVTLENVTLSNKKGRPCIRMAENCSLTLKLVGDNIFEGGGIMVPESSKLVIEGEGNLYIKISGSELYGIGNNEKNRHGILEFYQDGEIKIELGGMTGIGIGSGLGGDIRINKGKYVIQNNVDEGVGIGSINGEDNITIHDCDMQIEGAMYKGVLVGSVNNDTNIKIWRSLLNCNGTGKKIAMIGTVEGSKAVIDLSDMSTNLSARADISTAVGSYYGSTVFKFDTAGIKYAGIGKNGYVFGGISDDIKLDFYNNDIIIDLKTETGKVANVNDENYKRSFIRSKITVNGETETEGMA